MNEVEKPNFQIQDLLMTRVAAWPIENLLEMETEFNLKSNWIETIYQLFDTRADLREAIAIASPSLYQQLKTSHRTHNSKLAASLLNYVIRLCCRATPFGLFAFVGLGSWDQHESLNFDYSKLKKNSTYNFNHSAAQLLQSSKDQSLSNELIIVSNDNIIDRMGYLHVQQTYAWSNDHLSIKKESASIRKTKLVENILEITKVKQSIADLIHTLKYIFEDLSEQLTKKVITQLVNLQFLLPVFANKIDGGEDELYNNFMKGIAGYDEVAVGNGEVKLAELSDLNERLSESTALSEVLQINLHHQNDRFLLQHRIKKQLTQLLKVGWPLFSLPKSQEAYDFHQKFIAQFGTRQWVPLKKVMCQSYGLGELVEAGHYQCPKKNLPTQWSSWLCTEWQKCLIHKNDTILITDAIIKDNILSSIKDNNGSPLKQQKIPLPSFDLVFKKITGPKEANIQLISFNWQGFSTLGRHTQSFKESVSRSFSAFESKLQHANPRKVFVDLNFTPEQLRFTPLTHQGNKRNVSINWNLLKHQPNPDGVLYPEDIYIGATDHRMVVWSRALNQEIIPCMGSRVAMHLAPKAVRFLDAIARNNTQLIAPFNWGLLETVADFLPRIVLMNVVISPKRWLYRQLHTGSKEQVLSAFREWAKQWELPDQVLLIHKDQQLLMTWQHPAHKERLYRELSRKQLIEFHEYLEGSSIKSCHGHHEAEYVVPVVRQLIDNDIQLDRPYSDSLDINRLKFQSEWVYWKIYLTSDEMDLFLCEHIPLLLDYLTKHDLRVSWFFIRYSDPRPHLRLRIKVLPSDQPSKAKLLQHTQQWLEHKFHEQTLPQFELCIYQPELERFGDIELMPVIENIFISGSMGAILLLQHSRQRDYTWDRNLWLTLSVVSFILQFGLTLDEMLKIFNAPFRSASDLDYFRKNKKAFEFSFARILKIQGQGQGQGQFSTWCDTISSINQSYTPAIQELCHQWTHLSSSKRCDIAGSLKHLYANRLGASLQEETSISIFAYKLLIQTFHQTRKNS